MDQTARLRYLKQVILACPDDYVDFDEWGRTVQINAPPEIFDDLMAGGTVVCPLGLAALDPVFQKLGLRPRWGDLTQAHDIHGGYPIRILSVDYVVPGSALGQVYTNQEAAKMFFGISQEQVEDIFQHAETVAESIGEIDLALQSRSHDREFVEKLARDFGQRMLEVAEIELSTDVDFDAFLQWLVLTKGDSLSPEYQSFLKNLYRTAD